MYSSTVVPGQIWNSGASSYCWRWAGGYWPQEPLFHVSWIQWQQRWSWVNENSRCPTLLQGWLQLGMAVILVTKMGIPDVGAREGPEMSKTAFGRWKCQVLLLKRSCLVWVDLGSSFNKSGPKFPVILLSLTLSLFSKDWVNLDIAVTLICHVCSSFVKGIEN